MLILEPVLKREVTRRLLHADLLALRMQLNNLFEDLVLQPTDEVNLSYGVYTNELHYVLLKIINSNEIRHTGKLYVSDLIAENLDAERYIHALLWKWTEHMNGIYIGKWAKQWIHGEND